MEADSEGEINTNMEQIDASKRPKRQMKTPFQLEVLEETYATDTYPSEAIRAELSEKLNLTDRQLQMWFCHRRLKDKKEASGSSSKPRSVASIGKKGLAKSSREETVVAEPVTGQDSGSGTASGSSEYDDGDDIPMVPTRYHESPRIIMERRVVTRIEAQLGEPLRDDGPILGVEFDELPPGAFGAPIAAQKERYTHSFDSKSYRDYEGNHIKVTSSVPSEATEPKFRHESYGHAAPPYMYDSPVDGSAAKSMRIMHGNGHMLREYGAQGQVSSLEMLAQSGQPVQYSLSPRNMAHDEDGLYLERKRKIDEARIGKEVQAYEKKMKKELEKQELLRRKMEEQMRKEMERLDRERRKEEQRMIREQQKLEEKFQREERREMERREKFMQKERLRLERNKQKEERRKEKEALRQKAAMERAAARRIAKETMELIEDERLELMELASSSKGLSSIVSLDYDTLQNLELFREALCEFPPKSVHLRKPFSVQPWADSEENVGDLLMVWKFCVTFAEILGLWPFTLDEFMQSLHDYDSRLLCEIHMALLKLIVKDIEDVVRTPSGGPGTNQYSAVNPEGGHPRIIEGAYFWGFDIRNWQKHLNPLTLPEILRQFALSAGFGPHLKKKVIDRVSADDNNEVKGCEDIVSTLRNGSAAENAVAIMQEKGFGLQRKSRHRLTPGTVKFAAYHVLALEGSKGLNVIDLAEKIQKSGLRDLKTSKTPEASISVALSRDPVLFERIAPSTYCVRPAYRKDPADAESIIATAKEKIQRYTNGFLTGQNADEEERDDDSDGDIAEGAEIDAVAIPSEATKNIECDEFGSLSRDVKEKILCNTEQENGVKGDEGVREVNVNQDYEIDGDKSGELWVQGLTEGEYSDLSVEERLKALVALVGVANEGNSVRVILEERQDAANALKKQMWAEAQLDKRRIREEIFGKLYDSSFNAVTADGGVSPMVITENKTDPSLEKHESSLVMADARNSVDNLNQDASLGQPNGFTTERSRLQLKSYIGHKAEEMYVYRSLPLGQDRRRNRYWHFVASASPQDSGCGRIFVESPNGCWRLMDSEEAFDALLTSLDTRGIRESHLHIMLQKIEVCFKAGVQRNRSLRDVRNNRNKGIEASVTDTLLDRGSGACPSSGVVSSNSDALESSLPIKIDAGSNDRERRNLMKRYEDLQTWTWKECCHPSILCGLTHAKKRGLPLLAVCDLCVDTYDAKEQICPSCGEAGHERKLSEQFNRASINIDGANLTVKSPVRVRLIKALLSSLEVSVPSDALDSSWSEEFRCTWAIKLQNSSSNEELLEMLTLFENAIRRDHLSANFETTEELLCQYDATSKHDTAEVNEWGSVRQLPWMPKTSAAVALRLLELDGSIAYSTIMKPESNDEKKVEALPKFTLRYGHTKKTPKPDRYGSIKEEKWNSPVSSGSKQVIPGRGGGRPRSAKSLKGASGSASSNSVKPNSGRKRGGDILSEILNQQGPRAQRQVRGPRTVRKRRTENSNTLQDYLDSKSTSKKVQENCGTKQEFLDDYNARDRGTDVVGNDDDSSQSMEADGESDGNENENPYGFKKWGPSDYADVRDPCNSDEEREMSEEDLEEVDEEDDGFQNLRGELQTDDDMEIDEDNVAEESSDSSMVSGDYSD